MVILDCRGQQCPQPVVQVRRQILTSPETPLRVLVSDSAARDNIGRLAASRGFRMVVTEKGGGYQLELSPAEPAALQAAVPAAGPTVLLIASDQMGSGDAKLGQILMKNLLFTMAENDAAAPDLLLFVNGGARLTAGGSDVIEPLQKLVELGADIATCGLCLEYFGLKEALMVGRVTNMLEIVTTLQAAGRVIRP